MHCCRRLKLQGLRVAVNLGAFLLAVGSWVKVFSAQRNRFDVAFTGQTIVGVSQMFTLGAPAKLAAVWFPHHQVSTATAIGVFGNQVGTYIYSRNSARLTSVNFMRTPQRVTSDRTSYTIHITYITLVGMYTVYPGYKATLRCQTCCNTTF